MMSKTVLIICILILGTAILIANDQRNAKKKLHQSFEHNMNLLLCVLCPGNNSTCNTFDFQLDYKRHTDYSQYSNYLSKFLIIMMRLFDIWTRQPNHKIFFGTLKFNDTVVRSVAKTPKNFDYDMFKQIKNMNISTDVDSPTLNDKLNLLPIGVDNHNLVVCSKTNENSYPLLHNFFNSIIGVKNNNTQLWMETWVAARLNAELLILKLLNGYRYAPDIYGTCGQVYFVEDCGYTLQHHLHKMNLSNRLLVAKELLKLALELTDGSAHPNYSFYLTDLTADNIAIRLDKTTGLFLSLKVIDWTDVIVVANDNNETTNDNLHISEHIDCGLGCLTYSKEDICWASVSDHNVYAVCKEFLSIQGGLLHEITDLDNTILIQEKEIKELKSLLKHCLLHSDVVEDSKKSRLDTAKLIISTIDQIFKQNLYNFNKNN